MIKADLIDAIAAETKFSKKDTDIFIRAFIENVQKPWKKEIMFS